MRRGRRLGALAVAQLSLLASHHAFGQSTHTWNGGGGNNNWSTTANWVASSAADGNDEIHFAGSTRLAPNRDNTFNGYRIFFDGGAGAFSLTGNSLNLFNFGIAFPKIENNSTALQAVNFAVTLSGASATGSKEEIDPTNGDLVFNSTVALQAGTQLQIFGSTGGKTLTFNGAVGNSTNASFALNSANNVVFNAANTYTGDTYVNSGTLQVSSGGSVASEFIRLGDDGVSNSPAANLNLTSATGQTISTKFVIRPSSSGTIGVRTIHSTNTSGTTTLSGNVFLDADLTTNSNNPGATLAFTGSAIDLKDKTLTVRGTGNTFISGEVQNSTLGGKLIKGGLGTLTLTAGNTYSGGSTFSSGNTVLSGANGTLTSGNITINGGNLRLDNSASNNTDRLADAATLKFNGGTLTAIGNATTNFSESIGQFAIGTTAAEGGAATVVVQNGTAGSTSAVLDLGSTASPSHGDARTTVNFVGLGGNLGSAGNNPRIIFSIPPGLTNGVISNSNGSGNKGWATVNGSDFAGYDATNGVIPVTTTTVNGALSSSATVNVLVNATASASGSSSIQFNTMKISTTTANQTLDITGSGTLSVNGILLTGNNDYTIQNTGGGTGIVAGTATNIYYVDIARTLTINAGFGSQASAKSGPGILVVGNTANSGQTGAVAINDGAVRANPTTTLPSGAVRLRGGVLELNVTSAAVSYSPTLGTTGAAAGGVGNISFGPGGGGFSAFGSANGNAATVNLGGASASLTWASTSNFLGNDQPLILGSPAANRTVNFNNPINLNGGDREIQVNGATAQMNSALSGTSTMSSLVKTGRGSLTLNAANTYAGPTIVTAGTLTAASTSNIGTAALLMTNLNTGPGTDVVANLNNSAQTIGGLSGSLATPSSGTNTLTLNLGTSHVLTINQTADSIFAGVIAGSSGSIVKQGAARLTLSGANTYGGTTTISAGTLTVNSTSNLSTGALAVSNTNTGVGTAVVLNLNNSSQTIGGLSGTISTPTTGTNTLAINLATSHTLTINQGTDASFAGVISGSAASLIKQGTAKLTLTGANTYTGATTISNGTMALGTGGSIATSVQVASGAKFDVTAVAPFTLAAGEALSGSGTVVGSTVIAGIISPGDSPGTLTTGDENWAPGGQYTWEITDATGAYGTDWDKIAMSALTISATSTPGQEFTIKIVAPGGVVTHYDPNTPYTWKIATATGGISNFVANKFKLDLSAFTNNNSNLGGFDIQVNGNDVELHYVPEPGSGMMLIAGGMLALKRRVRRTRVSAK